MENQSVKNKFYQRKVNGSKLNSDDTENDSTTLKIPVQEKWMEFGREDNSDCKVQCGYVRKCNIKAMICGLLLLLVVIITSIVVFSLIKIFD